MQISALTGYGYAFFLFFLVSHDVDVGTLCTFSILQGSVKLFNVDSPGSRFARWIPWLLCSTSDCSKIVRSFHKTNYCFLI